jgi:hypothetical protein
MRILTKKDIAEIENAIVDIYDAVNGIENRRQSKAISGLIAINDRLGWKSRQRVHTNLLNRKTGL